MPRGDASRDSALSRARGLGSLRAGGWSRTKGPFRRPPVRNAFRLVIRRRYAARTTPPTGTLCSLLASVPFLGGSYAPMPRGDASRDSALSRARGLGSLRAGGWSRTKGPFRRPPVRNAFRLVSRRRYAARTTPPTGTLCSLLASVPFFRGVLSSDGTGTRVEKLCV